MDDSYARQGVRTVKSGLGDLFGGGAGGEDDPFVYQRPKDPASKAAAPSRVSLTD